MNKKFLIAGAILILMALGGGGYYLYSNQKKLDSLEPPSGTVPTPDIFTKEYKDENVGFSFKYPEGWIVDNHPEDKVNYAQVELTRDGGGKIVIWVKDPPAGTLEEWISEDSGLGKGSVIDTDWGGVASKKISVKGEKPVVATVTIYDDLLFLAEVYPTDKGKELEIYDGILTNFKFQPIAQAVENPPVVNKEKEAGTGDIPQGEQEDVYVEEEVVE